QVDLSCNAGTNCCTYNVKYALRKRRINIDNSQGLSLLFVACYLHAGDVDALLPQNVAQRANDTWTICVAHDDHVIRDRDFNLVTVDAHELLDLLRTGQGTSHSKLGALIGGSLDGQLVTVLRRIRGGDQTGSYATLLSQDWCVHVGNLIRH